MTDGGNQTGERSRAATRSRVRVLPSNGRLLISTDLHGNLEDLLQARAHFLELRTVEPETHWAMLGDFVHGPNEKARTDDPALYGYPDESDAVVREVIALHAAHPHHVHVVLGNHDYAHVGGMRTSKFYPDEAAALEARMPPGEIAAMKSLFREALLMVAAPCGVLLSHGSPGHGLLHPAQLEGVEYGSPRSDAEARLLREILTCYGQPSDVSARMLDRMSQGLGFPLFLVVHGHDRREVGWFTEGGNQIQPVLFGARRGDKRIIVLDLAGRYDSLSAMRDGVEIRRLHASPTGCRP